MWPLIKYSFSSRWPYTVHLRTTLNKLRGLSKKGGGVMKLGCGVGLLGELER